MCFKLLLHVSVVRLYCVMECIMSVVQVKRKGNIKRSLRTDNTHKCYSIYLPKRGQEYKVQPLAMCWSQWHMDSFCSLCWQYVCTYPTSWCSRMTQAHAQWDLNYKTQGACLQTMDIAKQFQEVWACAHRRGCRDVLTVLWALCMQWDLWASHTPCVQHMGLLGKREVEASCTWIFIF